MSKGARLLAFCYYLALGKHRRAARISFGLYRRYSRTAVARILPKRLLREYEAVARESQASEIRALFREARKQNEKSAWLEVVEKAQACLECSENCRTQPDLYEKHAIALQSLARHSEAIDVLIEGLSHNKHSAALSRALFCIQLNAGFFEIPDCYPVPSVGFFKKRISEYRKSRAVRGSAAIAVCLQAGVLPGDLRLPESLNPAFDYFLFASGPVPDLGFWQVNAIDTCYSDITDEVLRTRSRLLFPDYDIIVWISSDVVVRDDIQAMIDGFVHSELPVGGFLVPAMRMDALPGPGKTFDGAGNEPAAIDTRFLMLNLRHPAITELLELWWRKVEQSGLDGNSGLTHSLASMSLDWHKLGKPLVSLHNHPAFAVVPERDLTPWGYVSNALAGQTVDPYAGKPYAKVRERLGEYRNRTVDVVVCVHNALAEVKQCLASIERAARFVQMNLVVVDDGSDNETASFLAAYVRQAGAILVGHEQAKGYTQAANAGFAASAADFVIFLNSDTVVTDYWADKMLDALESVPGAGIVGPLSNAGGPQSIPEHKGAKGQSAINMLPAGLTPQDMSLYCEQWTPEGLVPRVPLVHGFCFGVRREVFEKLGGFDAERFPRGYGEEVDFCLRAADAGYQLVLATHTYVYHKKSQSYADEERRRLTNEGASRIRERFGNVRVDRAMKALEQNPLLERFREQARALYRQKTDSAVPTAPDGAVSDR